MCIDAYKLSLSQAFYNHLQLLIMISLTVKIGMSKKNPKISVEMAKNKTREKSVNVLLMLWQYKTHYVSPGIVSDIFNVLKTPTQWSG